MSVYIYICMLRNVRASASVNHHPVPVVIFVSVEFFELFPYIVMHLTCLLYINQFRFNFFCHFFCDHQ